MTKPTCPTCGSRRAAWSFDKHGRSHFECRCCRCVYVSPPPTQDELFALYTRKGDELGSSLCWRGSRRHCWPLWDRVLDAIESAIGRNGLLDVGCGGGQFLRFARERGWSELSGVELSSSAAEVARSASGARVCATDLMSAALPAAHYSGVTLFDVIEHVPDPASVLRRCATWLRPGGVIVIGTVHRHGLTMRLLKHRARVVCPPEHLAYFTRDGLRRLLKSAGFGVASVWCADVFVRDWLCWHSAAVAPNGAERQRYASAYDRLTNSNALLLAMRGANAALRALRLGDYITAVARKEPATAR